MEAFRTQHTHHPHSGHRDLNMVEGRLFGKILLFALPLMISNLLQMLYNAADMMVVSLSHEENAVGAIGTTGALINLVLHVFIGLSIGANVVIARRIGANEEKGASRAVHTALMMSLGLGFLGMAIGLLISRPVLALMGAQENLLDLAVLYTRIYFYGLPFIAVSNFEISIFRAKGDTQTPLIVLTLTGLLNVALNLFFVLVVRLSVEGVAIATAASNFASAALLLWRLSRDRGPCRFSFRLLRPDRSAVRDMVLIGVPAGIQGALFSFSNIIIQSSVLSVNNAMVPAGETFQPVVNGNAAAANLEGFVYTSTNAICQASITFTGQNVGAGKYHRVWRVLGCCYLITTAVALLLGGAILLLRQPLLSLYGIRPAEEGTLAAIAYRTACVRLLYMMTTYSLLALMEVGSGVMRGLGKSLTSTIVSLIGSCLLRILWLVTVFRAFGTLDMIYLSYPLSWGLTAICHFICVVIVLKCGKKAERLSEPAKAECESR